MATFTCPACQRLFENLENQDGPCPACGAEWNVHAGTPFYVVEGVNIRRLAQQQRWMVLFVFLTAVSMFGFVVIGAFAFGILMWVMLAVALAIRIAVIVGTAKMTVTMKWHVVLIILIVLLMFIEGINLIILLVVNISASGRLRRAGFSVGFLGVRDEEVVQRLGRGLCRKCGYDLTGNVSGRCPECGEPLPLAVPVPVAEAVPGPSPRIAGVQTSVSDATSWVG